MDVLAIVVLVIFVIVVIFLLYNYWRKRKEIAIENVSDSTDNNNVNNNNVNDNNVNDNSKNQEENIPSEQVQDSSNNQENNNNEDNVLETQDLIASNIPFQDDLNLNPKTEFNEETNNRLDSNTNSNMNSNLISNLIQNRIMGGSVSPSLLPSRFNIISWNLKLDSDKDRDKDNNKDVKLNRLCEELKTENVEIICFQEIDKYSYTYLQNVLGRLYEYWYMLENSNVAIISKYKAISSLTKESYNKTNSIMIIAFDNILIFNLLFKEGLAFEEDIKEDLEGVRVPVLICGSVKNNLDEYESIYNFKDAWNSYCSNNIVTENETGRTNKNSTTRNDGMLCHRINVNMIKLIGTNDIISKDNEPLQVSEHFGINASVSF
jgi:hypothetical protein